MKTEPKTSTIYGVTQLIDTLLDFKMDSKEFLSNEKIIAKIGSAVDKLNSNVNGHILMSITKDTKRNLLLITKAGNKFSTYSWKLEETIDKQVGVEVHEQSSSESIPEYIENKNNAFVRRAELASALVNESLNGFSTNKVMANQLLNIKNKNEKFNGPCDIALTFNHKTEELLTFGRKLLAHIDLCKHTSKKTLQDLADKHNVNITFQHDFDSVTSDKIFIGEITDVREIGGRRHYEVKWLSTKKFEANIKYGRITHSSSAAAESDSSNITIYKDSYVFENRCYDDHNADYKPENLEGIPYNFIDKGRLIIAFNNNSYDWKTIISPDPRVKEDFKEVFEKNCKEYLEECIEDGHSILKSRINIPSMNATISYQAYENNQKELTPDLTGIRLKLKSLKTMIDEHNYLVKKNTSIGKDVTITENIKYNHAEGKIAYNDFSIAVNDEFVKSRLYDLFNVYLMKYYRSEQTEQDILDTLVNDMFTIIAERINTGTKTKLNLPIKINDKIEIAVTGKVTNRFKVKEVEDDVPVSERKVITSQLFYINDIRFNKNEVLTVLREMTCYRSQQEADNFIENIGRLSLATYIGITTGYEVKIGEDSQLFKFKKLKGRSKFELLLDNTCIPINSKKLISMLYSKFIEEHVPGFESKIPELIYDGSKNSLHYLKYKVLIDSSYKAYKDKALEYLTKKVEELEGKFVKYYVKKSRKTLDGVYIKGLSGKNYVIAYDSKDSYVFMDPELDELSNEYKEGKYICMIDQSNIKSNISYDTIVAKILALKNDSSIAHTIYNLAEEL